jgi:two-component system, NtrC family, response regulator AtoC
MQISNNGRRILVGEDEPEVRGYFEMALKCLGYSVELAQDGNEVLSCLQSSAPATSAVLLDVMMPKRDGLDTLREIRRLKPNLPVIMISGAATPLHIVNAMKSGATDFLSKPVAHDDLRKAISKALDSKLLDFSPPSRGPVGPSKPFLGMSPNMIEIDSLVQQIGWSETPVLIQGETGSGKEVIARELHVQSPRASRPFLKVNCAALPSELVESELFGYERGAFTGAVQKKAGMFELADGGTMLLDEIGDMPIHLQAKLLQVLQDQEFQRIGGKETIKVDVRILAATHQNVEQAISEKRFREDLYYRLNVVNIQVPPLRERRTDIIPLGEILLKKHSIDGVPVPLITLDLKHAMLAYPWPGNVRELENVMRKLIVLRNSEMISAELNAKTNRQPRPAAPTAESHWTPAASPLPAEAPDSVEDVSIFHQATKAKRQAETEAIVAALNSTHWNRKEAAGLLKIEYKALLYKMKKLGVGEKPGVGQPVGSA